MESNAPRLSLVVAVAAVLLGITPGATTPPRAANPFLPKAPQSATSTASTESATSTTSSHGPRPRMQRMGFGGETAPLRTLVKVRRRPAKDMNGFKLLRPATGAGARRPSQNGMPFPDQQFQGVANTGTGAPPDPSGEAGPNHYIQGTNDGFAIFTKSDGTLRVGPTKISTLWEGSGGPCETKGKGDPIIQYDQLAQRWLITEFAFDLVGGQPTGPFYECVALTTTADPLGSYYLYTAQMSDDIFPDYPHFGVWPDAYYLTVHLFGTHGEGFQSLGVVAFDREAMLHGLPSARAQVQVLSQGGAPAYYGMLSADLDGTTPPPLGASLPLVAVNDSRDQIEIYHYQVNWMNPDATRLIGPTVLQTGPWDGNMCGGSRDCIPQANTTTRLDAAANQSVMYRAAYRNFGNRESLVFTHTVDATGTDRAGVRWYEIGGLSGTPALVQGATYSPDNLNRWQGSMASDRSGNIAVGFSASAADQFPSINYTGRLVNDSPDTLAQGEIFFSGGGSQTGSNRWGDYTHLSVDPQDDCTFWYTNEYYGSTGPTNWRTLIFSFRYPSCSPTIPPPPDALAPRIQNVRDNPDPFHPPKRTKVRWTLTEPATVDVGVFNPKGDLVSMIVVRKPLQAGDSFARWNGRTFSGSRAKPGKYKIVIEARDASGNVGRAKTFTTLI